MNKLAVIFTLLITAGCQHQPPATDLNSPLLQLPTTALTSEIAVIQKVTITYQDRPQSFIAQIEINHDGLVMVALTEFGGRLFTLSYDNKTIDYQPSPLLKTPIEPAYLLSDVQLIYWPQASINAALPSGMSLKQNNLKPYSRALYDGKEKVIDIQYNQNKYWQAKANFVQLQKNYSLTINSQDITQL